MAVDGGSVDAEADTEVISQHRRDRTPLGQNLVLRMRSTEHPYTLLPPSPNACVSSMSRLRVNY
jgi:hypothetical protein